MKRNLVVFLVLAMFAMIGSAVAQDAPKMHFGIKGGLNLANMSGDGWDQAAVEMETQFDDKYKMGFAFGLAAELPLGESGLVLQPEVLYVMKGAKTEFPEMVAEGYDITLEVKHDYIEIPVLIKYNVATQGGIAPSFFAGPIAAFNVSAKMEWDGVPAEASDELPDGDIENVKSVDFGVTFGAGFGMAVGESSKLTFDVRYTLGMADMYDDVPDSEYEEGKIYMTDDPGNAMDFKNSDIRLMVGFLF